MILTTEEVITAILKVISATTKLILASEEVITTTLKIMCATTKAIFVAVLYIQNNKYGNFVSTSRSTGKCAAQKNKKTFAVLVYGHVYIIWSY